MRLAMPMASAHAWVSGDQQRGQLASDQKGAHATSVSRAGQYRRSLRRPAAIDATAAVTAMLVWVLCLDMQCAYVLLASAALQLPDDN
ncbi:hypothetical protein XvhCFBP2543_18220 [Xanthomonas vasicola]|uniref:Uncharacterized protein n=1 Tax=Xanthomonas vasicola TaxID=56459 RepID=A0ABD7S7U0_XANVA|nr:hypothetical protein NX81_003105 [Xanthomonas vasicola]KGR45801.1 hypothetical protein NX04_04450 [Xanthomonas vasicola]KGR46019.1 hypothetical protein NX05_05925 [Xanthomonas vasicola]KGR62014.1 hypothetical protein NX79_03660 [Xanthomonas vasicola]PPV01272.1 hypothetical protein XvhCFBP2543_18220 [Xanthomonas vasicola]